MSNALISVVRKVKLLAVIMFLFTACQSVGQDKGGALSAADFDKKLTETSDYQLVDVRTPEEYSGGHIRNALNIDYNGANFNDDIAKLDKDKPTFVYCLSGGRSHNAAEEMRKMGFKTVYELNGGTMQWKAADKPLETGQSAPQMAGMSMEDFQKALKNNQLVLVDFNATWCPPCKRLKPIVEEISTENNGKMVLLSIDTDANQDLAMQMGIQNLPTLMVFKGGQLSWKQEGFTDKQTILQALGL